MLKFNSIVINAWPFYSLYLFIPPHPTPPLFIYSTVLVSVLFWVPCKVASWLKASPGEIRYPYHTIPYHTIPYHTIPYHTIPYHVWWPGIDKTLERYVQSCSSCQENRKSPQIAPLHPWEWPVKQWVRIHADYAGPFLGHMFLIVVDAFSKWMEVYPTNSSTSTVTIEKMRECFAIHGLPEQVVTDNGPSFNSEEFQKFMNRNGIRHIRTSPHHPSSNGQAERAVQTFKTGMMKLKEGTLPTKVARFLFNYRTTPHTTTGHSPAELMFGRKLRTRLDLLKPDISGHVRAQQARQKTYHNAHSKAREFSPGTKIYVQNFGAGSQWLSGEVLEKRGPLSYLVKLSDGRLFRRHVDHMRIRTTEDEVSLELDPSPWLDVMVPLTDPSAASPTAPVQPTTPLPPRRSSRQSHPPERYGVPVSH